MEGRRTYEIDGLVLDFFQADRFAVIRHLCSNSPWMELLLSELLREMKEEQINRIE